MYYDIFFCYNKIGDNMERKLIIKKHTNNPLVKFWNWGWNIYYKNPELWNYLIAGFLATLVTISSKMIFLKTFLDQTNGIDLQIAEVLSWCIGVTTAYLANKFLVFKTKNVNLLKEICSFVAARVFTQLLQMGIMYVFVTYLELNTDAWVLVFTLICAIMQIVVNYIISKLYTFKKK